MPELDNMDVWPRDCIAANHRPSRGVRERRGFRFGCRIGALLTVAVMLSLATPHIARGALVVADFNDLATGNLEGQAGGTGFTGNWNSGAVTIQVIGGDLSSANYNIAQLGTPQRVRGNSSTLAWKQSRGLATSMTGEIWFSFLVNNPSANARSGITFNDNASDGSSSDALFFFGLELRVRRNGVETNLGNVLTAGQTSLVVGQMILSNPGNDSLKIWMDPNLLSDPDINNYTPVFNNNAVDFLPTLTRVGMISYFTSSGLAGETDSIRFSDTPTAFFDVTGVGGEPITPEPSSFVLAATSLLGLLVSRRRARKR